MANKLQALLLITVVVFVAEGRRNVATLFCNDIRTIRAEVEVNNGETLFVPADCIKGRIQWNLPNPSTELDVQFQSQNPSNCFVSNYPERFANYEIIEDGVSTKPYRGNEHCISTSNVQLSVPVRYYLVYINFELRP
ncbi:uncharacterized protein LOC128181338 [Crassostrea angulata]|uniref:uncharacterized protein LOC128181338 n=1 Tax=Magallana angulata TaxID=2784310 RepID=UPI0022B216F2|nr:uncharacterized protein LOC128181338 [Crassostrea angulata]